MSIRNECYVSKRLPSLCVLIRQENRKIQSILQLFFNPKWEVSSLNYSLRKVYVSLVPVSAIFIFQIKSFVIQSRLVVLF